MDAGSLAQSVARASDQSFWLWTTILSLGGCVLFWFGFERVRRARLLEDLPSSKIRSAAQGYVELHGHSRLLPGPDIVSPLSGQRCCWWSYKVERHETRYEKSNPRYEWVTIEEATSDELFVLADDTGQCVVDPEGATVVPSVSRSWRGYHPQPHTFPETSPMFSVGDYRYTERLVRFGDWLYAVGQFRSQTAVRDDNESRDVSELLADWKRDQRDLLRRFDANRDGKIDLEEWEAARRAALEHVRAEQVERSLQPDLHVLSRPSDRRPFILSTKPQEELSRGFRWAAAACITGSVVSLGAAVFALIARGLLA